MNLPISVFLGNKKEKNEYFTMNTNDKIFIAGHTGMVGSAIVRLLKKREYNNLLLRSSKELDLCDARAVEAFLEKERPSVVIVAAAKVGGIYANNTYPAEFLHDNLAIALNIIHGAYCFGVSRLLFLGSSCIYPKAVPQPMAEEALLSGVLEKTNEAYAVAKITGLKLCQFYRRQYGVQFHSAMPANLYGPGDNYHLENSHVLPALIRRFHEAKEQNLPEVVIWGSGRTRREFLHVDDLAEAILHLLSLDHPEDWLNVGTGTDVTILELAELIKEVTGYKGKVMTDPSKPDGTMRKLLDISKIRASGWKPNISLEQGLIRTYRDFLMEKQDGRLRS
jgi:GDP-L-fucose synthase